MCTLVLLVGGIVVLLFIVCAGIALEPAANQVNFAAKNLAPSFEHPFGTDWMGRDMLARTLAGLSLSVRIGIVAALVSAAIALVLAAAAALGPRWVDSLVNALTDMLLGIPHIVLLMLISYALGKGYVGVVVGMALTHWPSLTRVLRAEILQVKGASYVVAARRLGQRSWQVALHHMLPAVLPQFVVGLVLMFPHIVLHEAAITFLGFGLSPEVPALGNILSESMQYLSLGFWWLAVFPGAALVCVVALFDGVGTRLRRLIDPVHAQD
jgi:peptide/nickel transport system permease protein